VSLDLERARLANGLPIAIAPIPHLHTATVVAGVRVGSRHETRERNGISHFLEHMLFRGTAEHPTAHEFNLAVERLGGTLHAATHSDFTTFELTLPPEHLPEGIAILAEIFRAPALRNLELEKRIVREEILDGVDEDGRDVDPDDLAHQAVFGDHPLGFKIAGTEEGLDHFDDASLRAWHARHYVARNTSICVAGAIDPAVIERALEKGFGGLAPGERCVPLPLERPARGPKTTYVDSTGSQTDVRIAFPSVGATHPLGTATELLSRVLDDGMSARLFRTIVEDEGLAYEAFGAYDAYDDVGLFLVGAAIEHGKTAALTRTVLELLARLRDRPIEPHELEKAKTRSLFELRAMLDHGAAIAEGVAVDLLFDRPIRLEDDTRKIAAVTLGDLRAAADATIRPENLQVVAVGMLPEGIERETRRIAGAFR
jgi:predicted Zn-dependent peptidase